MGKRQQKIQLFNDFPSHSILYSLILEAIKFISVLAHLRGLYYFDKAPESFKIFLEKTYSTNVLSLNNIWWGNNAASSIISYDICDVFILTWDSKNNAK